METGLSRETLREERDLNDDDDDDDVVCACAMPAYAHHIIVIYAS